MPERFGEKLRHLREQRQLTQKDLVRALGGGAQSHLSRVEAGRKQPSLDLVLRLAGLFDVSIDSLLRDEIPDPLMLSSARDFIDVRALPQQLGAHIRSLRQRRELSQVDLSQRVQLVSQAFISQLEAGRKVPSPEVLIALADALSVSVDELLTGPTDLDETGAPL